MSVLPLVHIFFNRKSNPFVFSIFVVFFFRSNEIDHQLHCHNQTDNIQFGLTINIFNNLIEIRKKIPCKSFKQFNKVITSNG